MSGKSIIHLQFKSTQECCRCDYDIPDMLRHTMGNTCSFSLLWRTILLVVVILFSGTHITEASQAVRIVTLDYPPYQYQEDGEVKGIAADIVKEVFKRLGREIEMTFYPFPRAINAIETGKADVIFTFYHKPEREAFALYSKEALVEQTISLFTHADSAIRFDGELSSLSENTFGMVRFSYGKTFDNAVKTGIIKHIEYVSEMRVNMDAFMLKRFDILPSDRWVALYYYAQASTDTPVRIRELSPAIQSFPAYIGFSKANKLEALRDEVDATLRKMRIDGSYQQILDSYLDDWKLE